MLILVYILTSFSGKTFLFSSLIDEIQGMLSNAQVVYFYCRFYESVQTSYNGILRSFVTQILAHNPTCSRYLYDYIIGGVRHHLSPTSEVCLEMLENLALHHEHLFIGIDGLDECVESDRRTVLHMIHKLLQNSKVLRNIRIFITSRKEKDIDTSLRSAHRLEIRHYHIEKDILKYVQVRVRSLSRKFPIKVEDQTRVSVDITERSRGTSLPNFRAFDTDRRN